MEIRKATASDADAIFELRRLAIMTHCPTHYPRALLSRWTEGEVTPGFIEFVTNKSFVGIVSGVVRASGAIDLSNGKVDAIFVDPEVNGSGYARKMMQFLEQQARLSGLGSLQLEATLNAADFYRRIGFVGDTLGQYHSPRGFDLDCIEMHKDLL